MADVTQPRQIGHSAAVPADGSCDIGELMSAYLDGELRDGELEQVVSHLTDCLPCIAEFHDLKEARTAVRMLPILQVPDRVMPAAHYGPELSAFLDGELSVEEQEMIVKHLQTCTDCLLELQDLDAARTAVRALPRVEPPIPLLPRLPVRSQRTSMRRLAVAAAGFIGAAFIAFNMAASGPEPTAVDLDQFADRHIVRVSVDDGAAVVPVIARRSSP
jgi:anti-sigma factor RsiW